MRHRFNTPLISLLILSIILFSSISNRFVRAEVITLTAESFNDKAKKPGTLWEDFGKEMEGEDEIEIGEVDCAMDKPVCSKVDIHSYPTFKLFYNGEEVTKYQGMK
ncbi:Protein disulfide-isomerase like 2-2 [Orobanche gracilis]